MKHSTSPIYNTLFGNQSSKIKIKVHDGRYVITCDSNNLYNSYYIDIFGSNKVIFDKPLDFTEIPTTIQEITFTKIDNVHLDIILPSNVTWLAFRQCEKLTRLPKMNKNTSTLNIRGSNNIDLIDIFDYNFKTIYHSRNSRQLDILETYSKVTGCDVVKYV